MNKITSFLGITVYVTPTNYFTYHVIIKTKKKEFSNASSDIENLRNFIDETLNRLIKIKLLSDIITINWYKKIINIHNNQVKNFLKS